MEETVPLLVKIDGKTVRIRANINWSVHQLKQQLYLHSNQSVEDLKVVFAGTELSNTVLLKVSFYFSTELLKKANFICSFFVKITLEFGFISFQISYVNFNFLNGSSF